MKFLVGENWRNPEKNLPRPRFVHHETHMEGPSRKLGTPAVGGERLTACATRPPPVINKRANTDNKDEYRIYNQRVFSNYTHTSEEVHRALRWPKGADLLCRWPVSLNLLVALEVCRSYATMSSPFNQFIIFLSLKNDYYYAELQKSIIFITSSWL